MVASRLEIALWPRGSHSEQYFTSLLQRYQQQSRSIPVNASWLNMQNPWSDVSQTMIRRSGADVTEVGSSWVESLVATNSLRPFSVKEMQILGGRDAFAQITLKQVGDAGFVYSFPHHLDARHIYYRRDLLAQAGVDEQTAFTTPQNFLQTLEALKCAGVESPLVIPIVSARMNLSFLASWLWSAGADFTNETGSQATFDSPEAIAAIADYFRAAAYIAPEFREMDIAETDTAFCKGKAAIVLSGSWLFYTLQQDVTLPQVKENFGIAIPVGHAYGGGTHLVIWQHCVQVEAAFELVRFLTSPQVQADLSVLNFVMPALLNATQLTPYAGDPNYQMLAKTLLSARPYGVSSLWNVVEARLSGSLVQFWPEYFATPGVDTNAFIAARLQPLARRINIALED